MPSPWNRDAERRFPRGVPISGPHQFRTTGYSPVKGVDPRTGGGPKDMRGNPIRVLGDPKAPFATVAGKKGLYPYGTNLLSPQFPGQQFSFRDTGTAPGIASGTTLDIATGSKQLMTSPQVNQPAATFYQGTVPSYSGAAGPETTLGSVSDVYGGSSPVSLGIGGYGGDQGPASYTPYQFSQPFGFDTSGDFGATPLPPSPDFSGDTSGIGFQMPPMTSMPNVDDSSLIAASGQMGGTMSTDTTRLYPDQTPSLSVGAGDIGSTYGGGQNYNYSPAPDGGTYVYDANWNYVATMPGSQDSGAPSGQTAQGGQPAPTSSTPTASSTPSQSAGDTSFSTPYATQTQQLSAPAQSTADYSYYSQPGMGGQSFASYGGGLSSIGGYFEGAQTANMTGSSFGDLGLGGSGMPAGWGPRLL